MARPAPIPYGDFIFRGLWEGGRDIGACGDRKHLPDLIKCIGDNRHLDQIRAARAGGFDLVFLVVEDVFRRTEDGDIELRRHSKVTKKSGDEPKGAWERVGFDHHRVDSYLMELELYAGVEVYFTASVKETAKRVISLYHLLQKAPEEHDSLTGFHTAPVPISLNGRPSLKRRVFKELAGVAWELSGRAEKRFEGWSLLEALGAGDSWQDIEGVGAGISASIEREANER